jgi:hypothetical protein
MLPPCPHLQCSTEIWSFADTDSDNSVSTTSEERMNDTMGIAHLHDNVGMKVLGTEWRLRMTEYLATRYPFLAYVGNSPSLKNLFKFPSVLKDGREYKFFKLPTKLP